MDFRESVLKACASKSLYFKDLAAAVGVHPSTVKSWVSGKSLPRIDVAQRVARYLGFSLDLSILKFDRFNINDHAASINIIEQLAITLSDHASFLKGNTDIALQCLEADGLVKKLPGSSSYASTENRLTKGIK